MREILFRGKGKTDRRWYEGYYFALSTTTYCFTEDYAAHPENTKHYITVERMTDWGLPNEHLKAEIDPETLGQYTGLKDKNGVRIFEGDILRGHNFLHESRTIYQAWFDEGCFYLFDEKGVSWHPSNIDNIEVIDNYYDNQELVEV